MIDTISDSSLKKHTKKNWQEWFVLLNEAGAAHWDHKQIVQFLKTKKQSLWWQQMIANGYEVKIGKRIPGQSLKGTYSATLTKTIPFEAKVIWKWLLSARGQDFWLRPLSKIEFVPGASFEIVGGIFGEIRTVKSGARIRFTWNEEDWPKSTTVQVLLVPRANKKTMLVIQHDGIQKARQKTDLRSYWRDIIDGVEAQIISLKRGR